MKGQKIGKKKENALPDVNGLISSRDPGKEYLALSKDEPAKAKPTLLLHSCCGPCSTACIEQLMADYEVTVFFYNPNIDDPEEYERRRDAQKEYLAQLNAGGGRVAFLEGAYEPQVFLKKIQGLEGEPEGGKRCSVCFQLRLQKTAETAKMQGYDYFATTLTVSPHKDYDTISSIGKRLAYQYGVDFLDRNFKKKDGYKRSLELSKKHGLYRQNYCGCNYSKWEGCDSSAFVKIERKD